MNMGSDKWTPDEPANREGTSGDDAGQSLGATAAFGQVKPASLPSGADDDLLNLLMGGEKKPAAPSVLPPAAVQAPVQPGPVVHQVDSGGTSHHDILSRMRSAETAAAATTPQPPAQSSGAFTQLFQSLGSSSKTGAEQSGAGGAAASFSTASSAPASVPAPAPSGGFTELFGKVSEAQSAPAMPPAASVEPVFPAAAPSAPPVAQPASQPGPQPGSFTQIFGSSGGSASASAAPSTPATTPAAPPVGGFTALFSTASTKEKEPSIPPAPESGTGAHRRSATGPFSNFGGAAANTTPAPPPPVASPAQQGGGFTQLFGKLPSEERALGSTPPVESSLPQPSLTQMFGALTGGSGSGGSGSSAPQQSTPPPDPSSFTQILAKVGSAGPSAPAPWEPRKEAGSSFTLQPEPGPNTANFGAAPASLASGPSSDPGMNVSVTRLLSRLDSPSSAPPISAPPPPAPSTGSAGSWTQTFETLASPSVPAPASPGGYVQAPASSSAATRAVSMQPGATPAPVAPPESSGPSEVTRIINASRLREDALRGGGAQAPQPAAASAPLPAAAPGMPAIPGVALPPAPQFSPQSLMHPGGAGAASGMNMPHMQAPAMNLKPPAAPAPAQAAPTGKLQQMIPLLLVVIIFLLVALLVTVIFLMKH